MSDSTDEYEEITDNDLPDEEPTADGPSEVATVDIFTPDAATDTDGDTITHHLRGMYRQWYLEYASYVILERAVPDIEDGLKPVQRRILHSMQTLDDGRFIKVANIVGNTMQYHPHGDASIKDALVQLGQKRLTVETQGNWGNILTGDDAAAGRYIEARLSPFALETLYNAKVTEWTPSYDGRNREPVTLPVKFPLLLAQGAEGIAVGLSSKILPHNFNELCDAAVAHLKGETYQLLPDFPTGGLMDVSRYNDGQRGGRLRIRAKIEKLDPKTLVITEIPYGKTTNTLIASILDAFEKGKIKIRKVDDNTTDTARVVVHLLPGTSSDKTIDALYAFTDCEVSLSPNCCVIRDKKPEFLGVGDVLAHSVDRTRTLLGRELEIQRQEVRERLFFASLERIFIERRIYKDKEYEQAGDAPAAVAHVGQRLQKWTRKLYRPVTEEDILRLLEIPMKRIIRYNADKADALIESYLKRIEELTFHLDHLTDYAIDWFHHLKDKYGHDYVRRTTIRNFDNIQAATVAEATERLYINREEGFIGTSLRQDELVAPCSMLDDVIIFYRDGRYKVVRVQEKLSVGKNIRHIAIFKRGDDRTIYNVIYQNGRQGGYYAKRFNVTGVVRDKEYDLTRGLPGSRIAYFTANLNGEAEVVRVTLKADTRLRKLQFDVDFAGIAIKGRGVVGNLVTRNPVLRFDKKEQGGSTLGGRKVWYDPDVMRLNYDGRGRLLGEFHSDDRILVVLDNGEYYTSGFEATNRYEDNVMRIEKLQPDTIWTAVLVDQSNGGYPYLKRFEFKPVSAPTRYLGENPSNELVYLTDNPEAKFRIDFPEDSGREPLEVTAADFVEPKSVQAKGKRLTDRPYQKIEDISPERMPEEPEEPNQENTTDNQENAESQPSLFPEL